MKKLLSKSCIIGLLFTFLICCNITLAKIPKTIPAIKEWKDATGLYVFTPKSRIVIDKNFIAKLTPEAQTFLEDIKSLKNDNLIIKNDEIPVQGDIYLTMNSTDSILENEGYSMNISDYITINARTEAGVFYGTRTFLQLLKQSDTIKGGIIQDWPGYQQRGLMIDNGRKFFSVSWLENQIKDLAYIKLNYFHFHISDNDGFRLECSNFPEIQSSEYYKKTDIKNLIELANKYHVMIVPEIDLPGHVAAILPHFPQLCLTDTNGNKSSSAIDITLDESRIFIKKLIEEYLPLFSGPYWHAGADEYISDFQLYPQMKKYALDHYGINSNPKDVFFGYINWVDSIVKSYGKTLRIWNDGLSKDDGVNYAVTVNKDIVVEHWVGFYQIQGLIDDGYKVMNCDADWLYYVLGQLWKPNEEYLYSSWQPYIFEGTKYVTVDHQQNLGSKLQVWCDCNFCETEDQVAIGMCNTLRILSQINWESAKLDSNLNEFKKTIKMIGRAPGFYQPDNPIPGDLAYHKNVYASSTLPGSDRTPELAVDGNYTTYWTSNTSDSSWIYVDLGQSYNINKVYLNWEHDFPHTFDIQISNDSKEWKTIYHTDGANAGLNFIRYLTGMGQYVKISCSNSATNKNFSLLEFEVYDSTLTEAKDIHQVDVNKIKSYPNPSNNNVEIYYNVDIPGFVKMLILDDNGNIIDLLVNEQKSNGTYNITWDTERIPSGSYFCKMTNNNSAVTTKIILLK